MKTIFLILFLLYFIDLRAMTSYEEFKANLKKVKFIEVSPEKQKYRDHLMTTIDKRAKGLGKFFKTEKAKKRVNEIKECINLKTEEKEMLHCVPSILRGAY